MATTRGLGKGLGALISMFDEDMEELNNTGAKSPKIAQTPTVIGSESNKEKIMAFSTVARSVTEINIDLIDNNTSQPRKSFNMEEMHELEQSIATHGVLQPILLNKVGSRYMIVAGERRWRAAKAVGLKSIPALVRNYTPKQIAEISLVENLMRSDLSEIEIAIGIKKLMDTYTMTQEQVSSVLGKSRSAVANSLRLLNLPREVQDLLEAKVITMGHAKCLAAINDKTTCISLANKCAGGLMTVRELESTVSNSNGQRLSSFSNSPIKSQSIELKEFTNVLTQTLATKVYIQGNEKQGKIVIEYSSPKELERIRALTTRNNSRL